MSDYLRELGVLFGGDGDWMGGALVVSAVVIIVVGGAWILFRKSKARSRQYDWSEGGLELSRSEVPEEMFADEGGDPPGDDADLFGSREEKQVQLEADVQGLSHRLTVVAVLIPLLFVIVLVFVYLDLTHRIGRLEDPDAAGKKVAQILYEELSDQVRELSEKLDRLQQSQTKRLSDLEATTAAVEKGLKAHSGRIEAVASSKGDGDRIRAELMEPIGKLTTRLSSLEKNAAAHGSELKRLSTEMAKQAKETAQSLSALKRTLQSGKERISQMEGDLTEIKRRFLELELNQKLLSEDKAGKGAVTALRTEQERLEENLGKRMKSLETDITRLAEQYVRFSSEPGSVDGTREGDIDAGVSPPQGGANIFEQDISR